MTKADRAGQLDADAGMEIEMTHWKSPHTYASGVLMLLLPISALLCCTIFDVDDSNDLDWFTSPCQELGGQETAAGACFIPCELAEDCPLDTLWCPTGGSTWISGQCEVRDSETWGCGPDGWRTEPWGCYMTCSGDARDWECPAGFHCVEDAIRHGEYFCTGQPSTSGGTCGEPCASGCCSSSGAFCCAPPYCAGDCIGSPCCG